MIYGLTPTSKVSRQDGVFKSIFRKMRKALLLKFYETTKFNTRHKTKKKDKFLVRKYSKSL